MNPLPFQTAPRTGQGVSRPPALARHDPRWVLAARAALSATPSGRVPGKAVDGLVQWAAGFGIAPIHARAAVNIAERAVARGGLDAQAASELAALPEPVVRASHRAAVVCWVTIPLLSAVAAYMVWLRFGG